MTNNFEVTIPAGKRVGLLRVKIHDDSKNEDDGEIIATVMTGTGYTPAVTNNSATISINDDDPEVPVLSITSTASMTGVTEGLSFKFTVEADNTVSGSALTFAQPFIKSDQPDGATNLIMASIVETTFEIAEGQREATFTVQLATDGDVTSSDSIGIIVRLIEGEEYDTSDRDSINVRVKDNDAPSATTPVVEISAGVNYAVRSGMIHQYRITSSPPTTSIVDSNVMITLRDATTSAVTSYIHPVQLTPLSPTHTLILNPQGANGHSGADLITITVLDGTGYVLSNDAAKQEKSIVLLNQLPKLSIAEIAPVHESVGKFSFTITSDIQPHAGHPIIINRPGDTQTLIVTEDTRGHQYNPRFTSDPILITNTSPNNSVDVEVTFTEDSDYHGWQNIVVWVNIGSDFEVNESARQIFVLIQENELSSRLVSISEHPQSVVEGDPFDITLTASEAVPTGESIEIELDGNW